MIKIVYAASWFARRRFYSFSHELYKTCPVWAEPAVWGGRGVMSVRNNPLMRRPHVFLAAVEDGRMVSRVLVGCVDGRGYFSMFDSEDNETAVRMLIREAMLWLKKQGAEQMIGPVSPHPVDLGGGVLMDGFEDRTAFGDAYNAPYYDRLLMAAGAEIYREQMAYRVKRRRFDMDKYDCAAEWAKRRFGYEAVNGMDAGPRALTEAICSVMGAEADGEGMARTIGAAQGYLLGEMCPVVFVCGQPVGYLLTIRDRRKKDGRARIVSMWVHENWRRKGVTALLFSSAAREMDRLGVEEIDASWVQLDNGGSRRSIENAGGVAVHRYRQYVFKN